MQGEVYIPGAVLSVCCTLELPCGLRVSVHLPHACHRYSHLCLTCLISCVLLHRGKYSTCHLDSLLDVTNF